MLKRGKGRWDDGVDGEGRGGERRMGSGGEERMIDYWGMWGGWEGKEGERVG